MKLEGIHLSKAKAGQDHFPAWLENFIIVMIVLVIIHTVVDDLAVAGHWAHSTVRFIVVAGFLFDLFFTIEFVGRSMASRNHGGFSFYIRHQRGWIDLLSSVPLLLLVSGPALVILIDMDFFDGSLHLSGGAGVGFLSVLKTAKAIRVTRILRLIRVVKLFGKIQNTNSVMTGRHVGSISTICVVSLLLMFVVLDMVPGVRIGDQGDYFEKRRGELEVLFRGAGEKGSPREEWYLNYLDDSKVNNDIIKITREDGTEVYTNGDADKLKYTAYPDTIELDNGYEITLSHHPADSAHARVNMFILAGIIFIIGAMMLIYTGIFAREIADPVFIMDKGLRELEYNLEVKVNPSKSDDEVFRLARAFNVKWLPLKSQIAEYRKQRSNQKSVLSMDDLI